LIMRILVHSVLVLFVLCFGLPVFAEDSCAYLVLLRGVEIDEK
jgi:hypothetical protein